MAPLFSALVIVSGVALLLAVAFAAARFFQPASVAIRIALVFVFGSAIGGVASLAGLAFFVSSTLRELMAGYCLLGRTWVWCPSWRCIAGCALHQTPRSNPAPKRTAASGVRLAPR